MEARIESINTEGIFTKTEMKNDRNVNFLQNANSSKGIETEAVLTKTEMKNEWNINFLPNTMYVHKVLRLDFYLLR